MSEDRLIQRSKAALNGVAVGDAFGKMTEGYFPPEVEQRYGGLVDRFMSPITPRSATSWSYAEVTDDTRFTILIAESIIAVGKVDEKDIVRRILEKPIKGWPGWEEFREKALKGEKTTRTGNGAPMRVAPIGIIHSTSKLKELVQDVEKGCSCTHNTRSALSAACAVAAAFSAAIEDRDKKVILEVAIEAAELGKQLGEEDFCPDVARRLKWVRECSRKDNIYGGINPGFEAWQGAVYALALVYHYDNAKEAIVAAASVGGDADSIASISGGILAAKSPNTLPREWVEVVETVNHLNLDLLAEGLAGLRD